MFKVPDSTCPKCQRIQAAAIHEGRALPPKPGDLTVCTGCGEISRFDSEMGLRTMSPAEWNLLPLDTRSQLRQMQRIVHRTN